MNLWDEKLDEVQRLQATIGQLERRIETLESNPSEPGSGRPSSAKIWIAAATLLLLLALAWTWIVCRAPKDKKSSLKKAT